MADYHVSGLDHVTMIVSDLVRTHGFYSHFLGLERIERPAFSFPGSWYSAGAVQLHFIETHHESGPCAGTFPVGKRVSRTFHIALAVDDWETAIQRIHDHEIEIADGPKIRPDGVRQVYLRDPDGHLVELCCVQS